MRYQRTNVASGGWSRRYRFAVLALLLITAGCGHEQKIDFTSSFDPPTVQVVRPDKQTIVRIVGQPSFIESYERSSVYPKMTAYIERWNVDIGDIVKQNDVLATLFVPELVEDFGTKKATVERDRQQVDLDLKLVDVAAADVKAADAHLTETQAALADFQAQVDRWTVQVERLQRETKRGVVDAQVLLESQNQLKASASARDKAKAAIARAEAEVESAKANLAKANVDVQVARADLAVAESEARRLEALVGYLKLYAPFDGIIVARNANTGDFVLPATGDPTAMARAPDLSPSGAAAPIFVVDRLDIVRIFVDVPEADADFVKEGTKASVLIQGYRDEEIPGSVTRVSWGLNVTSRTLRAEIDLPNPNAAIRPGMYAYAKLTIEHPDVRAVPLSALDYRGGRTYGWLCKDGKAIRNEVETGISNDRWIEITRRRVMSTKPTPGDDDGWTELDGSEEFIVGDLSLLSSGMMVEAQAHPATSKIAVSEPEQAPVPRE